MAVSVVLLLAACGESKLKDPLNWEVEQFSYMDQNGKTFGSSDLKKKGMDS
jgi:protein SCO1/2